MNHLLYLGFLWIFLLLPIALLGVRWTYPKAMPWWLIVIAMGIVSWPLINGSVHFYFAYLDDLLRSYGDHPPQDLVERWANDGSKRTFALLFGWMYGLVYFLPWAVLYALLQLSRSLYARRRSCQDGP